jgi:hypothetical protein
MMAVAIDLRELTDRRLRTALETMGKACLYRAPCIIGTLIERKDRRLLDNADVDETSVAELVKAGFLEVPDDQFDAACALQAAYDTKNRDALRELARPWIDAPPATGKPEQVTG